MTQTYTIKPLEWTEFMHRYQNPDGSPEVSMRYIACNIISYYIAQYSDGTCHANAHIGAEYRDSEWLESVDACKEWCWRFHVDYLSDVLEPAAVNAWESAVQTARLNNPYSIDAFTPVTEEDWARLNDLVMRGFGHGIDRYSAAMMVMAWDGCTATIEAMATETTEVTEE